MVALAQHLLPSPPLPTTYFYLDSGAVRGVTVVGQSPGIEGVKACVTSRAWSWVPVRGRLAKPPASLHQLAEWAASLKHLVQSAIRRLLLVFEAHGLAHGWWHQRGACRRCR